MYRSVYVAALTLAVAALPAAVALAVLAGVLDLPVGARVGLGLAAAAALVLGVLLRMHEAMVHRRSGQLWPYCRGNLYPREEEQFDKMLRAALDRREGLLKETKPAAAVVGSGWGFFAKRRGPEGQRIYTHRMRGLVQETPFEQTWLAGSTIHEVSKKLYKKNLCFWSHPTMDYISLGAWFALGNHGNGGDAGKPSSYAFKRARVVNLHTGLEQSIQSYKELRGLFDEEESGGEVGDGQYRKYAITSVTFDLTKTREAKTRVRKRRVDVRDVDSAQEWLQPLAFQRVLFLGGARDFALGVRWESFYGRDGEYPVDHKDPHFGSRWGMFWQADICSVVGGCEIGRASSRERV